MIAVHGEFSPLAVISLSHVGIKTSHNDEPRRHPFPLGPPRVPSLPCISLCCSLRFHLASTSSPVFLTLADSWLCLHREESCFPQGYSDAGCLGTFAPVLWGHLAKKTSARFGSLTSQ